MAGADIDAGDENVMCIAQGAFEQDGTPRRNAGRRLLAVGTVLVAIGRVHVVIVKNFRVPISIVSFLHPVLQSKGFVAYIMIFQVSTGKSASLNDQSNFSSATGSSVGSW